MESIMARWKIAYPRKEPTINDYDKEELYATQKDMVSKCIGMYSAESLYDDWITAIPDGATCDKATWEEFRKALEQFYKPTLKNYQFRSLAQESQETFVTYVNRVEKGARQCDFKCDSVTCIAAEKAIRDQIINWNIEQQYTGRYIKQFVNKKLAGLRRNIS